MKPGWYWVLIFIFSFWPAKCEVEKDYPEEKYGIKPTIAKIWCGSPTCLDKLKE